MSKSSFKKLRAILEAVEDLPVHPSDASNEVPEKLKEEGSTEDLPVHPSDASNEVPEKLSEEEESEDELKEESEEDEEEEENLSEESDNEDEKKVTEETEDELKEESEEEKKEISEEDEDDIIFDDEDVQAAMEYVEEEEDEEEKLSEESDNEDEKKVTEETEDELKEESEEDLEKLTKDLPEDFKVKAKTIFESAVKRLATKKTKNVTEKLIKYANLRAKKLLSKQKNNLTKKVDGYVDYIAEDWMKKNRVAIDNSIKVELMESLMGGLKNLFEAHNINIPTSKVNLIEELTKKVSSLEKELNSVLNSNVELKKKNTLLVKESIIDAMSNDLSKSEKLKLKDLIKPLTFENEDSFKKRISSIKESYFKVSKSEKTEALDSQILSEGGIKNNTQQENDGIKMLALEISRQLKNQ